MKLSKWLPLVGLLTLGNAHAADQIITLEDGRQIVLKADFTWEYLPTTSSPSSNDTDKPISSIANMISATTPAAQTVTVLEPTQKSAANIAADAPASPAAKAMGTPFKVDQNQEVVRVNQSGVTVVVGSPQWEDGELVFPTEIINNGLQPTIEVDLMVEIYDDNGQMLLREEFPVWRSIKRMASTYLRPGNSEDGTAIRAKLMRADQYQIRAQISDISTRG